MDLVHALVQWCESVSGVELDRHVQVKNGLASARYPVELVESFLRVVTARRLLGGGNFCRRRAWRSVGERKSFTSKTRGRPWCHGMGVWEPVLRKDMDAEGAKIVSPRRVDADKDDADRPKYRSRLVVREIKKAMKKSNVPSAAELFSGMPLLECVCVKALLSLFVSHSQEEAKGERTVAMYDVSRAHFHGIPVLVGKRHVLDIRWKVRQEVPFGWEHLDGNFVLEPCDPASGRAELEADTEHVAMVLRDLGLEKPSPGVTLVAKRPKSEKLLLLAGVKPLNAEDATLYRSSLDRPFLSFAAGSLVRGMKESHEKRRRGTQRCWTLLERATSWSNCV